MLTTLADQPAVLDEDVRIAWLKKGKLREAPNPGCASRCGAWFVIGSISSRPR